MALIRWQPRESYALQREIDNLVNRFWGDVGSWNGNDWQPSVDVVESEHEFTLHAELPGLNREDIQVRFENQVLTIEGERKSEEEQQDKQFFRRERTYGKFKRAFRLGTEVDAGKIAATYKDGVLTLTVPKAETAKPHQIEVAVS